MCIRDRYPGSDVRAVPCPPRQSGYAEQNEFLSSDRQRFPRFDPPHHHLLPHGLCDGGLHGRPAAVSYTHLESSQLYVYNPSIYGLAVESDIGATNLIAGDNHGIAGVNNNGIPRSFVAYYGISTQEDVSSQVGYSHKTIGLGKPTVSASSSGALGFSIGIAGSKSDYLGRSFTLYYRCV